MRSFNLTNGLSKTVTLFLIASVLTLIQSCTTNAENINKEAPRPPMLSIAVDGFIAKSGPVQEQMEIAGTIEPQQEVILLSELQKKIVRVLIQEGKQVSKGTVLFQLDDSDLQAQLERLRQQEKLALLVEQRLKDLIDHEAAIQQDYDQAFTNLQVLKAEIRLLQVTIEKTRIRAPFNGRIGIVKVYPGALVSPTTELATIVDDATVKIDFSIPEKYARYIPLGSKHAFSLESDNKAHTATIIAREATLNSGTRSLLVRAVAPNPGHTILAGQSARIRLALNEASESLMIPTNALMPSAEGYVVYKSENGKAAVHPVQIGQRSAQEVQILSGVTKGDTIITTNLLRLMPGVPLNLVQLN